MRERKLPPTSDRARPDDSLGDDPLHGHLIAELGDRYEFERELTPGGMARVFCARERGLDRLVVVKLTQHDELHARAAARFRRETQHAAQLSHPNVVPVLAAGEIQGFLYYVMPYVDGESLRARLRREGQLDLHDAITLTTEAASALDYAHRRGIVHRDIKPENILLEDGHARIADFGLARALDEPAITGPGAMLGTAAYISPEQASGERDIDGRADMYSLACVLFEMLAGEPPFTGNSTQTIIAKRFIGPPPSVRHLRETVPESVDAVLRRAMARSPRDRYQTAAEFADALRAAAQQSPFTPAQPSAEHGSVDAHGQSDAASQSHRRRRRRIVAVAVLPLILLVGGYTFIPAQYRADLRTLMRRASLGLTDDRIVVAPLENRTGDSTLNMLGDMAADWISQGLLQLGEFQVVDGRTATVTAYVVRRIPRPLRSGDRGIALAEEVGASLLLSGSYYLEGDSITFAVSATAVGPRQMLRTMAPLTVPRSAPISYMPLLAQRASGLVAIATDTTAAPSVKTTVPPSFQAYRALVTGWGRFLEKRDTAALYASVRQAQQFDSRYLAPLLYKAFAHAYFHELPAVDSLLTIVAPRYGELTMPEARAFDLLKAQVGTDNEAQLRAAHALLRVTPGSIEAVIATVLSAWDVNRPHEALAVLATVSPERGAFLRMDLHWQYRAYSQHLIGDYAGQLSTAIEAKRRHSDFYAHSNDRVRALAALGRLRDLERHLSERIERGDSTEIWRVWRVMEAARELRAHGYSSAATPLFEQLAADSFVVADTGRSGALRRVNVLYDLGRWGQAGSVIDEVAALMPDDVEVHGWRGSIAARLGRRADADSVDAWLANRDNRYLHGRHTYWRARIAAARADPARATRLLEQAFAEGYPMNRQPGNEEVHLTPDFAELRTYPPFVQLMRPRR